MDEMEKKYIKEIFETMTETQQKAICALIGMALTQKPDDIIEHHGIKGMKWGVRRYQNYDGSYTQKGLERYKKAESVYDKAKKEQKNGIGSREEVRVAKRKMSKAYDKLKIDKMADEGGKVYSKGQKTPNNTAHNAIVTESVVITGAKIVSGLLVSSRNPKLSSISGSTIAIGGTAINAILAARANSENKKLRAYYSHQH